MFQITIAAKHSVITKGVNVIKTAFPSIKDWYLVWVVPPRREVSYSNKHNPLFQNTYVYTVPENDYSPNMPNRNYDSDSDPSESEVIINNL